jgi:hypothetical protein
MNFAFSGGGLFACVLLFWLKEIMNAMEFRENGTADKSAQSHASGGRIHVCLLAYVLFGSRERLGFGLENPQGFGMMNAD